MARSTSRRRRSRSPRKGSCPKRSPVRVNRSPPRKDSRKGGKPGSPRRSPRRSPPRKRTPPRRSRSRRGGSARGGRRSRSRRRSLGRRRSRSGGKGRKRGRDDSRGKGKGKGGKFSDKDGKKDFMGGGLMPGTRHDSRELYVRSGPGIAFPEKGKGRKNYKGRLKGDWKCRMCGFERNYRERLLCTKCEHENPQPDPYYVKLPYDHWKMVEMREEEEKEYRKRKAAREAAFKEMEAQAEGGGGEEETPKMEELSGDEARQRDDQAAEAQEFAAIISSDMAKKNPGQTNPFEGVLPGM